MSSLGKANETSFDVDDVHYIPLVVIRSTSSAFSMLGSACIIYMSSHKLGNVMQRLLLGLSICDFFASAGLFSVTFLLPSYFGLPGAIGNHASCAGVGFIYSSFVLSATVYNGLVGLITIWWSDENSRIKTFKDRFSWKQQCMPALS
jgi:hypothetical protein